MRCETPEADGKPCVSEGKTRKEIKRKMRLFGLAQTSWKNLLDYRPGINWYCKYKLEADKSFIEHVKYIPRKRKASNKQKVEYFLTLTFHGLFLLARCTS